jgi:hypothetical protein
MLVPSMKLPRPILGLLVLSICGLLVEIIVALRTDVLTLDYRLVVFAGRLLLDASILGALFIRRREVWFALVLIQGFAVAWRSVVMVALLVLWASQGTGVGWRIVGLGFYLWMSLASCFLLQLRGTRAYFGFSERRSG